MLNYPSTLTCINTASSTHSDSQTVTTIKDEWYAVVYSGNPYKSPSISNADNITALSMDVNNGCGITVFQATSTSCTITFSGLGGYQRTVQLTQ